MSANILSIGSAVPSKQTLLGSAEISAEGNVVPSNADPSETPFLPMFLQMLFMQSQTKPVQEQASGTFALSTEGQTDGTAEIAAEVQSGPSISILAGSIDGLTRLTMERTQPAMEALKSQLAQIQRPRNGEDETMVLPSLFGRNMRMPVTNVHEIILAVAKENGTFAGKESGEGKSDQSASIILDTEEMKTQISSELLSTPVRSEESASVQVPAPAVMSTVLAGTVPAKDYIDLDTVEQHTRQTIDGQQRSSAPEKNETVVVDSEKMKTIRSSEERAVPENRQPKVLDASSSSSRNDAFRESMAAASKNSAEAIPLNAVRTMNSAVNDQQETTPQEPLREFAAVQVKQSSGDIKTEKKQRSNRSSAAPENVKEEILRIIDEGTVTVTPGADEASAGNSSDEDRSSGKPMTGQNDVIIDKQPQPSLKQDNQEVRRTASETEIGSLKAPAGVNDAQRTERILTEPFKPETVRSMMEQISKGIAVAVNEERSEMKLILHPEALGEVTVRVQVEEGKVTAKLDVQQVQVKNTIEANIPQLREALTSRGLTMERIEISTAQNGLADGTAKNHQQKSGKRSHRGFETSEEEAEIVKMYGYNTVEYTI